MKEDEDKGDRGTHFLPYHYLISVLDSFSCTQSCYVNHWWKNVSVSEQRGSLLCLHFFIFCVDLYDSEDEINEHQPFPSLSQVILFIYYITFITSQLIATYFSCCFCVKVKATLFLPLHSQIFHAVPEHVGFNIELKWICQMKVSRKYHLLCSDMCNKHYIVLLCCFSSQDGSWDSNLSTYFNMNTYLDIILSCVLQQAGKRRIVFSCFDPDICTM